MQVQLINLDQMKRVLAHMSSGQARFPALDQRTVVEAAADAANWLLMAMGADINIMTESAVPPASHDTQGVIKESP